MQEAIRRSRNPFIRAVCTKGSGRASSMRARTTDHAGGVRCSDDKNGKPQVRKQVEHSRHAPGLEDELGRLQPELRRASDHCYPEVDDDDGKQKVGNGERKKNAPKVRTLSKIE